MHLEDATDLKLLITACIWELKTECENNPGIIQSTLVRKFCWAKLRDSNRTVSLEKVLIEQEADPNKCKLQR